MPDLAATGDVDALPAAPAVTDRRSQLTKNGGPTPGKCYVKAGAHNLSPIKDDNGHRGSGQSVVRHFRLDLE